MSDDVAKSDVEELLTHAYNYIPLLHQKSRASRLIRDLSAALRQENEWRQEAAESLDEAQYEREQLRAELKRAQDAYYGTNDDVCQALGNVLGYPWFKYDQKNFPGATEENGVCVGDHVAESIAVEAARTIEQLRAESARLKENHVHEVEGVLEDRDYWKGRAEEAEKLLGDMVCG